MPVVLLRRVGLPWTTLQRRAGLVPLVRVATYDWPSLPSSPPLMFGRHTPKPAFSLV